MPEEKEEEYDPHFPAPIVPIINEEGWSPGVGKRKAAMAKVFIRPGTGKITINGKNWVDYFTNIIIRAVAIEPLIATEKVNLVDIYASLSGGGQMGQAGALKQGIAMALITRDPELGFVLTHSKMKSRDPRVVERKHTGRRKARRRQQWVKR
eukprot:TRINITY_DN1265_c0_g1_i2.p1 TRINITY_DN1265_c0_g1~~TRINITY_DN1265_c0_g1_i2.p1  ORF type:complete len:152 (+),score=17.59 TRINITY_DN1265_c0_g1_i2:203-658(+)